MLGELLYAYVLVLVSETIEGLRSKFRKQKAFEGKGLKVILEVTNVMICGGVTKDGGLSMWEL